MIILWEIIFHLIKNDFIKNKRSYNISNKELLNNETVINVDKHHYNNNTHYDEIMNEKNNDNENENENENDNENKNENENDNNINNKNKSNLFEKHQLNDMEKAILDSNFNKMQRNVELRMKQIENEMKVMQKMQKMRKRENFFFFDQKQKYVF